MEERFNSHLEYLAKEYKIIHLVLAVSGGVDSVVLTHLLKTSGFSFSIAHCNFHLRGEDSNKDEKFISDLAEQLEVDCQIREFNTGIYADENGISIQMAARELRYNWFRELSSESTYMATAHHANDVAETMLFNLSKGTGLAGLHGIREFDGLTVRPLLWASKDEIQSYAFSKGLTWRDDASNSSTKYMRNLIRHELVPVIENINPNFVKTNLRSTQRFKEAEEFLEYAVDQLGLIQQKGEKICINKDKLLMCPGRPSVLYSLLNNYGFTYEQVIAINKALDNTGAMFYTNDWLLNVDRRELIITANEERSEVITIENSSNEVRIGQNLITIKVVDAKEYKISKDSNVAALDYDLLSFPLQVRQYLVGESFHPLGMKGRKKISDFLIDEKVPRALKQEVRVLVSNNEIAWLLGMRIDDRYKLNPVTQKVYELRIRSQGS